MANNGAAKAKQEGGVEAERDADAFLLAAMDRVAQAGETTILHRTLEELAAAEKQYGYALNAIGRDAEGEAMLERAAMHYREAADLAHKLAEVRRTEAAVLEERHQGASSAGGR